MKKELSMSNFDAATHSDPVPGDSYDMQAQPAASQISAGGLLRQSREAAGLHIAALAVALKVPVKKIEAIEADRFIELPDAVFVRALASSICRTLKVDAAPVLQRLPQIGSPKLGIRNPGINAPFRSPGDGPRPSIWAQVSRPAVLAGVVMLLGAVVIIILPFMRPGAIDVKSGPPGQDNLSGNNKEPFKTNVAMASAENHSADAAGHAVGAADLFPPGPASPDEVASFQASASSFIPAISTSGRAESQPVATSAVLVLPSAPLDSAASLLPASGIVVFTAKSQSWVEVTDARGRVVLRRNLAAGEIAGASGALPLSAVVGRADVTEVQIRGKAFDLSAHARDNVARFEVK
jgi:cytoskeleton protein RodZ